jgi:hypothetical protein
MRFAYADPPYLGWAAYYADHPDHARWNRPETHHQLVAELCEGWPDGWALSLQSNALRTILPWCPDDTRVMAWTKPWCSWKPNGAVAYAWEPVLVRGGRPMPPRTNQARDFCAVSMAMGTGMRGAKPEGLCRWLFTVWNAQPGDVLDDLFPGTGGVARAWERFMAQRPLPWSRPASHPTLDLDTL